MIGPPQVEDSDLRLGPFSIEWHLGRGGMADVWQGRHIESGERVAIKVLSGFAAHKAIWREAFRQEIRAVAGLSHPAIVHVHEFGEVPQDFHPDLHPGSSYLVMEFVPGGSLVGRLGKVAWPELRTILARCLDGLAHAHARGLVHRDIKPGNVLGEGDGVKLADFGICHDVAEPGQRPEEVAGTPAYMAPEQWVSAWRDFGPWTDLYGLGCLAWTLAAGKVPFGRGRNRRSLREQHLREEPARLKPAMPVPRGFEDWLRALLVKDPRGRIQRAADALWSLLDLGDDLVDSFGSPASAPAYEPTFLDTRWSVVLPAELERLDADMVTAARGPEHVVRVPRSWRRGQHPPPLLPGVGRSLVGFRHARLVGREEEQDRLWAGLLDVAERRRPRFIVLHGDAGSGKSRLARWMAERSHEVGASELVRVDCDSARDPLVAAIVDHLRLRRATHEQRLSRIHRHLVAHDVEDPYVTAELRDFLTPIEERSNRSIAAMADPNARLVAPVALLRRLSSRRPVVLWLDDLHERPALVSLFRALAGLDDAPILVLATVRDDLESGAQLLRQLEDVDEVERLPIHPIPQGAWSELAGSVIPLSPALAEQVGQRAAGNPLFAVQLVADWVQRDLLREGPDGFALRKGGVADLPDGLHQVWLERVEDLLSARPTGDGQALEIACLLGARVDESEWLAACAQAGCVPGEGLMERLLARQLASAEPAVPGAPRRWAFAHGLLRESLRRRADEAGRSAENHRACAAAILEAGEAFASERAGRHFVEGDAPADALQLLLLAAAQRVDRGDWELAERLVDLRETALDRLGVAAVDERRGRNRALLSGMELGRNRPDRASEVAHRLLRDAQAAGWQPLEVDARLVLARVACARGELPEARDQFEAAELLAEELQDRGLEVNSRAGLGLVRLLEGQLGTARGVTVAARDGYGRLGDTHGVAAMNLQLSWIAAQAREWTRANTHVEEAASQFERLRARSGMAQCRTHQGWLARAAGDGAAAEAALLDAVELNRALGGAGALAPLVKLGVLRCEQGELEEGRRTLEEALAGLERIGAWDSMGVLQALLLPACAASADWEAWDRLLPDAEVLLAGTGLADDDVATFVRWAGDLAAEHGQSERARRAWLLALGQLHRLGRAPEARALQERVQRGTPTLQ